MTDRDRISTALLALRLGVFVVMFMWTLDKFVNSPHALRVFENFYGLGGFGPGLMAAIGIAEVILVLAFAGRCACEVRNPRGACCLGDVAAVVKRVAAAADEVRLKPDSTVEKNEWQGHR
jgi:hypothetical protein